MPSMRRTAVTQCASRTRKRRAPVSRRRLRGGAKSANKQSKDAKVQTVIKQMVRCSKDVTTKLQKYHDDPAGEEQFTKLMTEVLTMAGDTDSKVVKTTLNNLMPHGKYKIRTVSRTEIEKVCREMHADRGFMKRNTSSTSPWMLVIISCFTAGSFFSVPTLLFMLSIHRKLNMQTQQWTLIMFLIGSAFGIHHAYKDLTLWSKNIDKLEQIVKQC